MRHELEESNTDHERQEPQYSQYIPATMTFFQTLLVVFFFCGVCVCVCVCHGVKHRPQVISSESLTSWNCFFLSEKLKCGGIVYQTNQQTKQTNTQTHTHTHQPTNNMGVSFNGGTQNLHRKMMIFSRNTNSCWGNPPF